MRVRFAPSPTGFLHIGNARTAVANYLISRKTGATMVLRIEDTDMERSSKESEISIMSDLRWLGIDWQEGPDKGGSYGPYRQSERFDIYRQYTDRLLAEGKAYRCYCSSEDLDAQRKEAEAGGSAFSYPGTCRHLTDDDRKKLEAQGKKPAIRFHVPAGESIVVDDLIKGEVAFGSEFIGGDFIIVRSDGVPVYNYIVVIDDTLMAITHVIRGEDHLSNTPKQVMIARALNLPVPQFAHLALVLGPDRSKLSKRHGITSVDLYRKEGYLPEALFNYLSMLGWAAQSGEEILSVDDIVREIDLQHLAKSAAVFDFQKLRWMNGMYIKSSPLDRITDLCLPYLREAGYHVDALPRPKLEAIIGIARNYCDILSEITNVIGIFLDEVPQPDAEADTELRQEHGRAVVAAAHELAGSEINEGNVATELIPKIKAKTSLKGKQLFHPVRAMLTGRLAGPELDRVIPIIGFELVKKRIESCYRTYA